MFPFQVSSKRKEDWFGRDIKIKESDSIGGNIRGYHVHFYHVIVLRGWQSKFVADVRVACISNINTQNNHQVEIIVVIQVLWL